MGRDTHFLVYVQFSEYLGGIQEMLIFVDSTEDKTH
jgi:hypothetical protein